jgi:hypothetical protein
LCCRIVPQAILAPLYEQERLVLCCRVVPQAILAPLHEFVALDHELTEGAFGDVREVTSLVIK